MVQQGQTIELTRRGPVGERLRAYRYRIGGRDSKRVQRGGFAEGLCDRSSRSHACDSVGQLGFGQTRSSLVSATVERVRACRRMIQVKDLLPFRHVDVFSERPYAGNGLIVVFGGVENAADRLLAVAQELRQFETMLSSVGWR